MLYVMTVAKYLLPLITLPYLTRVLTPEYYGVTTYMTYTMSYFQAVIDFGYQYSATREASLYRNDRKKLGEILSAAVVSKMILCIISFLIMLIIVNFADILKTNFSLVLLYFLSVAVTVFFPDFIYRGMEKMKIVSTRFLIPRLISTGLTFILIRSSDDLILIPILAVIGNLAAVIFSFLHLYGKEHIKLTAVRSQDIIGSLRSSSVFFGATLATTAFGATTTFLMGVEDLPSADISFWTLAYQLVCTIEMLFDPIISSIYPHIVKKKDPGIIKKALLIFMPLIILGVAFCMIFAGFFINAVGGEDYTDAIPVFRILLPMLIFSFPAQLIGFPLLAPLKKEKLATASTFISACFHISGLVLLILLGRFTLINIALLRTCTNFVLLVFRLIFARRALSAGKLQDRDNEDTFR